MPLELRPAPQSVKAFPGSEHIRHDIYPSISPSLTPALHQPEKVVLITGAGRGCGRAMALQYAHARVAGIVLVSRTLPELEEVEREIGKINQDIKVAKHVVNVSDEKSVFNCAAAVEKEFHGRLDVLVNNAGVAYAWLPLADTDPSEWWSTYEINLKGPYLFLRALLPLLTATAENFKTLTHVVNITSQGAHMISPGGSAYFTSKLALIRLTELVDVEEAGRGVCAVAVHPGGVATKLANQFEEVRACKSD